MGVRASVERVRRAKRRSKGRSIKLSATVKEAVADVQVEISEESAEASPGAPGPRTGGRYPSSEGGATDRRAPRELADA